MLLCVCVNHEFLGCSVGFYRVLDKWSLGLKGLFSLGEKGGGGDSYGKHFFLEFS